MNKVQMNLGFTVALVLTISLILGLFLTAIQSYQVISRVKSKHFSLSELYDDIKEVDYGIHTDLFKSITSRHFEPSISIQINEFEKLIQKIAQQSKFTEEQIKKIEELKAPFIQSLRETQNLIATKNYQEAKNLLTSFGFQQLDIKLRAQINHRITNYREAESKALAKSLFQVKFLISFLFLSFFFLGSSWFLMISAFNKSEKEKLEANKLLEEERLIAAQNLKLAAIGEMAGNIAHEINNPLAIIRGYAQQLKKSSVLGGDDSRDYKSVSKIIETTDRISKVVRSLLKISRNQGTHLSNSYTSVNSIILDAVNLSRENLKARGISIQVDIESTKNLEFLCPSIEFSQVILNLLNNASDAIENLNNKWIRIRSLFNENPSSLLIKVTDSGNGISPEVLEKIMTPYFSTKPVGKGTGIGLSISQKIVSENGGQLFYNSQSNNTEFVIELPLRKDNHRFLGTISPEKKTA